MKWTPATLLAGFAIIASGCAGGMFGLGGSSGGEIRMVSQSEQRLILDGDFTHAFYDVNPTGEASFMLSDQSPEDLLAGGVRDARFLHVELLWRPKAGHTPLKPTATNTSVRFVLIVDGEVGVYAGAGFASPSGKPGDNRMSLDIKDASLQLLDHTAGFNDVMGPSRLTGSFSARRNSEKARTMHYAVSQAVTNSLGRTRFVSR